jgi:homoserine O-acetyltransferase
LAKRFDANTYIALTGAMASHDVGRGRGGVVAALESITVPVVVVSIDTDRLVPPRLQAEIAELVPTAKEVISISSDFGHDGFLVESEAVGAAIRAALGTI